MPASETINMNQRLKVKLYSQRCGVLRDLVLFVQKNVKNAHGEVLILVK